MKEGKVEIKNDILIYQYDHRMSHTEVQLNKLQYVYAILTVDKTPTLFCFDSRQHRIPVNFKGFKKVYEVLSKRFNFDDKVFYATISSEEPVKNRIWKRKYEQNYKIIDEIFPIKQGIKVLNPDKEVVTWDMTCNRLLESKLVEISTDDYKQQCIRFKHPVQIGNIIIYNLFARIMYLNKEAPVQNYYCQLRNAKGNDRSYYEAKSSLSKLLKQNEKIGSYERRDQNSFNYEINEINFSITYWYDDKYSFESNYTSLNIRNVREYPHLYINTDDSTIESIENYLIFNCNLSTSDKYKENENIKEKPVVIKKLSHSKPCIWYNKDKNVIGFAGSKFCQEVKDENIDSIHLQNVHPAKGQGFSLLQIKLKDKERKLHILGGRYKDFDDYISKIELVTKRKIIIEKEHADI